MKRRNLQSWKCALTAGMAFVSMLFRLRWKVFKGRGRHVHRRISAEVLQGWLLRRSRNFGYTKRVVTIGRMGRNICKVNQVLPLKRSMLKWRASSVIPTTSFPTTARRCCFISEVALGWLWVRKLGQKRNHVRRSDLAEQGSVYWWCHWHWKRKYTCRML